MSKNVYTRPQINAHTNVLEYFICCPAKQTKNNFHPFEMKILQELELGLINQNPVRRQKWLNIRVMGTFIFSINVLILYGLLMHKVNLTHHKNIELSIKNATFLEHMSQFSIDDALNAIKSNQPDQVQDKFVINLFNHLLPYLLKEPTVPVNQSCQHPKLPEPECETYNEVFDGKREKPAKIAIAFKFGFEADVLEVALHQYSQTVSKIFLFEGTRTHLHRNRKPLIWERLRLQPRFEKFQNVVHLLVDDAPHSEADNSDQWKFEHYQDSQLWVKLQEWNNGTKYFAHDDILIVGDLDEVPSLQTLQTLKHCQRKTDIDAINGAIWFPFGDIDDAFQTDWPASSSKSNTYLPHSLNAPAIWTWQSAAKKVQQERKLPRMIGHQIPSLEGGMHMTQYAYVPYFMTKMMSISEGGSFQFLLEQTQLAINSNNITILEHELSSPYRSFANRIIKVKDLPELEKGIVDIPWFLGCNLQRFPNWQRRPDPRLQ